MTNVVLNAIYTRQAELDMDDTFTAAATGHVQILANAYRNNLRFSSREGYNQCLLSKLFFDKLHMFPQNQPVTDVKFDSPSHIVPFEAFINRSFRPEMKKIQQQQMFKMLQKGDVISLEVLSSTENTYELKVLEIFGCHRKVNDLEFLAYLPKMDITGNELQTSELIRAAISDILQDFKVNVTLDTNSMRQDLGVKLGRISARCLPTHIKIADKFSCTADYVRSLPLFWNAFTFKNAAKRMGLDLSGIYSFDENWNRKEFPPETCGRALAESVINEQFNKHFKAGTEFYNSKNIISALDSFDRCIQLSPNNAEVFEIRGNLYSEMKEKGVSSKAIIDWKTALKLNPASEVAKVALSNALLHISKSCAFKRKNKKAKKIINLSIAFNNQNVNAVKRLKLFKEKSPEASTSRLRKKSIVDREAKTQKLEAQLRGYSKRF